MRAIQANVWTPLAFILRTTTRVVAEGRSAGSPLMALDANVTPCDRLPMMEATMALWRWLVALLRRKPDPLPPEGRRYLDELAAIEANAVSAGIHPPGRLNS